MPEKKRFKLNEEILCAVFNIWFTACWKMSLDIMTMLFGQTLESVVLTSSSVVPVTAHCSPLSHCLDMRRDINTSGSRRSRVFLVSDSRVVFQHHGGVSPLWCHRHVTITSTLTQTPTASSLSSASFVSESNWAGTPRGEDDMNNSTNTRRFLTRVQSTTADRPPTARRRLLLPLCLCLLSVCVSPPSLATSPPLCLCLQPLSLSGSTPVIFLWNGSRRGLNMRLPCLISFNHKRKAVMKSRASKPAR